MLKAPQNNNTLNWFGPGQDPGDSWHRPRRDLVHADDLQLQSDARFTTNCFAQPGAENGGLPEFGNLGWNVIDGPGFWNLDASVFRTFPMRERMKLEVRAEGFAVMNTPQWNNPDTGISSSTFGQITGAGGARSMQLAAKFIF